jgi:H+-translocating NAD(P) transhydrogenase subunit alpha
VKLAVPREARAGERRVALVPESVKRLASTAGVDVAVEASAGASASFSDDDYRTAGASIEISRAALLEGADFVVKIQPPSLDEIREMRPGTVLAGVLDARTDPGLLRALAAQRLTAVALELVPRTTLAQMMDVLTSQATVAGYRAVLLAAHALPRFFPMLVTAAGTVPPARVLVLGAGVAGLQAIATARRLGGVVEALDVRRAAREQVESLGAKFVDPNLPGDAEGTGGYARQIAEESQLRLREVVRGRLAHADVCITTALVPGRRAPVLVTADMVRGMRQGSVIVDLAAPQGGNCELTRPGETTIQHGVTILAPMNAAADVAVHASQMYSRNVERLVAHLVRDGVLALDFDDEIIRAAVVTHAGEVVGAMRTGAA